MLNALFLRWNQIRAKGGLMIARALGGNERLQIFDGSFNSFGSDELYGLISSHNPLNHQKSEGDLFKEK